MEEDYFNIKNLCMCRFQSVDDKKIEDYVVGKSCYLNSGSPELIVEKVQGDIVFCHAKNKLLKLSIDLPFVCFTLKEVIMFRKCIITDTTVCYN